MAYEKIESHDEYLKTVEQYQDYEAGTYQSMTLEEKMDFFDGVHTNRVPLFDEDGDDMELLMITMQSEMSFWSILSNLL